MLLFVNRSMNMYVDLCVCVFVCVCVCACAFACVCLCCLISLLCRSTFYIEYRLAGDEMYRTEECPLEIAAQKSSVAKSKLKDKDKDSRVQSTESNGNAIDFGYSHSLSFAPSLKCRNFLLRMY